MEEGAVTRTRLERVDTLLLRAHTDPGVAVAQELRARGDVRRCDVAAGAHVEPLDYDGAVELRGIGGTADDEPGPVGRGRGGLGGPVTVGSERADRAVRRGNTVEEVLVLGVA